MLAGILRVQCWEKNEGKQNNLYNPYKKTT